MSTPRGEVRPVTEEQVRDDLMRLDMYRNQLSQMLQQHQMISASKTDHLRGRETLDGLDRPAPEMELLLPVGGDTFVRGSPRDSERVLLGIGSGIVVEMERAKASEVLAERLVRLDQAGQDLETQMRALEERITVLSSRLEALSQGAERPGADAPDSDVGRD
ncbi:MAG: prefoldin subunit alpha [Thermoplasmata archaeon]|nr:prefoldin subunit alpha [Thermoplasmata archaeon]